MRREVFFAVKFFTHVIKLLMRRRVRKGSLVRLFKIFHEDNQWRNYVFGAPRHDASQTAVLRSSHISSEYPRLRKKIIILRHEGNLARLRQRPLAPSDSSFSGWRPEATAAIRLYIFISPNHGSSSMHNSKHNIQQNRQIDKNLTTLSRRSQ